MNAMSESHWWFLFHKEVKSWGSTTCFRIWPFQILGLKIFKCISWLNGFFFVGGDYQYFLKERVKTYLMTSMSPLNSPSVLLFSHLWSMAVIDVRCFCSALVVLSRRCLMVLGLVPKYFSRRLEQWTLAGLADRVRANALWVLQDRCGWFEIFVSLVIEITKALWSIA